MQLSKNLSLSRFQWATQKVKELFANQPGAVYYDVGAGDNYLVNTIDPGRTYSKSFDLVPHDETIEGWNIQQSFPYNYPKANIVTFLEIVEHLNNPWLCIKNISDMIAPGGHLILTTPNPGWSSSRVDLLLKGSLTCFTQSDLDLNHHVFIVWPHILKKLLNDNGFEIVEAVSLDGKTEIFGKRLKLSSAILQIPARIIKKLIEYKDPNAIGMSYGVVARKIG